MHAYFNSHLLDQSVQIYGDMYLMTAPMINIHIVLLQ